MAWNMQASRTSLSYLWAPINTISQFAAWRALIVTLRLFLVWSIACSHVIHLSCGWKVYEPNWTFQRSLTLFGVGCVDRLFSVFCFWCYATCKLQTRIANTLENIWSTTKNVNATRNNKNSWFIGPLHGNHEISKLTFGSAIHMTTDNQQSYVLTKKINATHWLTSLASFDLCNLTWQRTHPAGRLSIWSFSMSVDLILLKAWALSSISFSSSIHMMQSQRGGFLDKCIKRATPWCMPTIA